jgi:hypothetical protein
MAKVRKATIVKVITGRENLILLIFSLDLNNESDPLTAKSTAAAKRIQANPNQ